MKTTSTKITQKVNFENEVGLSDTVAGFEHRFNFLESELGRLYQHAPFGLHTLDAEGKFVAINDKELEWLGYSEDELLGKMKFVDLLTDDSEKKYLNHLAETKRTGVDKDIELALISKNNAIVNFVLYSNAVLKQNDADYHYRSVLFNIDLRKSMEARLNIAEIVFEIHDCMMITDVNCVIVRVNKAFNKVTGYSAKEAVGKTPKFLSSGRYDRQFYDAMWASINNNGVWHGEIWDKRKNGEIFPAQLTITAVKDKRNVITNYVASLIDISESKAATEEIKNLAFYDSLTQLPNRRYLIEQLRQAISTAQYKHKNGAVMFLDLDHFKRLNDTFGHNIGDLLLKEVAGNIKKSLRDTDTVARIGGDEFVIVLQNLSDNKINALAEVTAIGKKILKSFRNGYELDGNKHSCTGSIGVTFFSKYDVNEDELLKQADIAMYEAKKSGRNNIRFFDPEMQKNISDSVRLDHDLRLAIEQEDFALYYQMQVNNVGKPIGAEALIRWISANDEVISPLSFIPLAENTGLIFPLGEWVIDEACAQLQKWQRREETSALTISINVSALEFKQPGFIEQVRSAVSRYDISPSSLSIELTESTLLDDFDSIISKMTELTKFGIKFELDDFGTGYSSLQYLKKLPVTHLKIDQSFVHDIDTDDSDKKLVHAIINMARSLDIRVIAEGVETQNQLEFLQNSGCDIYQGYFFGKPLPIADFESALKSGHFPIVAPASL